MQGTQYATKRSILCRGAFCGPTQQPKPPGGLNAFYWYQIFALDSAVVEVQEMFSSQGGHLTNAMYHHGKDSNQINTP